MGSQHEHGTKGGTKGGGISSLVRLVTLGLAVAAVVKEMRLPADERTWHGTVAGVVPYEFRPPTLERFRQRVWDPEAETVVSPHVFGVGWTVNLGRIVALVRERIATSR